MVETGVQRVRRTEKDENRGRPRKTDKHADMISQRPDGLIFDKQTNKNNNNEKPTRTGGKRERGSFSLMHRHDSAQRVCVTCGLEGYSRHWDMCRQTTDRVAAPSVHKLTMTPQYCPYMSKSTEKFPSCLHRSSART